MDINIKVNERNIQLKLIVYILSVICFNKKLYLFCFVFGFFYYYFFFFFGCGCLFLSLFWGCFFFFCFPYVA